MTGALVQWLRDNPGSSRPLRSICRQCVRQRRLLQPAFSGLFAPYWRPDARGVITGLTSYVTKAHLARAALEATAWQVADIVEAMNRESGLDLTMLKVDGGMTASDLLLQIQADVINAPVVRPTITETTCLGAAYAAGLAVGFWPDRTACGKTGAWTGGGAGHVGGGTAAERARWRKAVTAPWTKTRAPERLPAPAGQPPRRATMAYDRLSRPLPPR